MLNTVEPLSVVNENFRIDRLKLILR